MTYKTTRLSPGKHSSPAQGACVMELASMLAGEQFTDTPQSVCPVIRDFLRAYNDRIDDQRRQQLYACAAAVVGSRSTAAVERERLRLCAKATHSVRWGWAALLTFPVFPLRRHAALRAGWALATGRDSQAAHALALVKDLLDAGRQTSQLDDRTSPPCEALAPPPPRPPAPQQPAREQTIKHDGPATPSLPSVVEVEGAHRARERTEPLQLSRALGQSSPAPATGGRPRRPSTARTRCAAR